jgi:hypothetical protein
LASFVLVVAGCAGEPASRANAPAPTVEGAVEPVAAPAFEPANPTVTGDASAPAAVLDARPPECRPADWSARTLSPIIAPGKRPNASHVDRFAARDMKFAAACGDFPSGPPNDHVPPYVRDGVEVRVTSAAPAGSSGRRWSGSQCTFEVALANGSGRPVELGPDVVPPFNSVTALQSSGSAAWLELSFNGYTREFPKGGNRVVAVDLCDGRVVWKSKDGTSNGGLLLLGDYLITAFGFTSERRFVHVLDARSGASIQKLSVVENICPSKAWAPNWDGGRCDAPGQAVGAATEPRIEGGLFLVDTNTGSSAFQVK